MTAKDTWLRPAAQAIASTSVVPEEEMRQPCRTSIPSVFETSTPSPSPDRVQWTAQAQFVDGIRRGGF